MHIHNMIYKYTYICIFRTCDSGHMYGCTELCWSEFGCAIYDGMYLYLNYEYTQSFRDGYVFIYIHYSEDESSATFMNWVVQVYIYMYICM
jgi:hypothetical protein